MGRQDRIFFNIPIRWDWTSSLIWLKSGNSKPYTKNEAFSLSFLLVTKNQKIGPKSVSSFSSFFTASHLLMPQYFGLRYMQIKMAETVEEEFDKRDKNQGYRRIWKQKTLAIQEDFIFAIFIVQSTHF